MYALPAPLGKNEDYKDNFQNVLEDLQKEKDEPNPKSKFLTIAQRYIVKPEKDMVLSSNETIDLLRTLCLPVYKRTEGHACHFKDVIVAMTKHALTQKGMTDLDRVFSSKNINQEW